MLFVIFLYRDSFVHKWVRARHKQVSHSKCLEDCPCHRAALRTNRSRLVSGTGCRQAGDSRAWDRDARSLSSGYRLELRWFAGRRSAPRTPRDGLWLRCSRRARRPDNIRAPWRSSRRFRSPAWAGKCAGGVARALRLSRSSLEANRPF